MTREAMDHLWNPTGALEHPVTRIAACAVVGALVLAPLAMLGLGRRMDEKTRKDVWTRYWTWVVIAPVMFVPILLGAGPAIATVTIVSILCYREFARATGLFRERLSSAIVALGIILVGLAALDNWYNLFLILPAWFTVGLAAGNVLADRPSGYIQRTALASVGFLLFGSGLGHLAFMANARVPGDLNWDYRPLMCMVILTLQFNDIAAYVCGKSFGRRHLFPHTSPNKTLGGHIGALVLTTALSVWLGRMVFAGTALAGWGHLVTIGMVLSVGGQLGDLVLGSIKRDLGVKDLASTLPGHGGVSDRFNNALITAPVIFHYVNFFLHVAPAEPIRIFTGGAVGTGAG